MRIIFAIATIIIFFTSCKNHKTPNIAKNSDIIKIDSVPQLTYPQMLKEYDTLVSYIKQISPIVYYNKEVRGIDFEKHTKKLKAQINAKTTLPEYLNILQRTVNAAQDNHTSVIWESLVNTIKEHWIPGGVKVIGYDSLAVNYAKHYDSYFNKTFSTKLNLELIYSSGEYYNLLPFIYNQKRFPSSMKLIKCNGENVHQFVGRMTELVSALKWDRAYDRTYYENFYQTPFIYKQDSLSLVFLDKKNTEHLLKIAKQDTVTFLETKKNDFGYNPNNVVTSHYFKKERIFYAKLPQMEEVLGDTINNRLKSIISKNPVDAIVIDIRGNGGGSDNTYAKFLEKVIKEPLELDLKVGRNYSPIIREYYEINKDTISNNQDYSFELGGSSPSLEKNEMYYIKYSPYTFVAPDSVQYQFNGKIYILQDRFIYSSASNLSNLAYKSEQLISIGENPNLLGGLQTNPIAICLPYSKLFMRIEPQIDFTNIKTKADIFQNNVEYPVNYSIDFLHERITTDKDVNGKYFLLNKDPIFKKVLELENLKVK